MSVLYSETLLDHFRHPRNYGSLAEPDISYEEFNPLCGDRIRIELKLEQAVVKEARFKGDGCAISTAAASLLTELVLGARIEELARIPDERLISALESDIKPARLQCALLALEALRAGLKGFSAHSAEGAEYESQGQARAKRSASPLVRE
jgi:nitrogen fixation NifU-like protein